MKTYDARALYGIVLVLVASAPMPASADEFGLVACTMDPRGRLTATVIDVSDPRPQTRRTQTSFAAELVGKPCATVIGVLMESDFELVGRTPITLCERGPCPVPPPPPLPRPPTTPTSNPDCLIWDIAGDGIAGPMDFALISCEVAARGGPKINMVQSDARETNDLLRGAKGRACSDFMADWLSAGGRLLGRSVVPFETLTAQHSSRRRARVRFYEPMNNSIIFELRAR